MAKRGKIPILTLLGLGMGLKRAYDHYNDTPAQYKSSAMTSLMTGYMDAEYAAARGKPKAGFYIDDALPFYGPIAGGAMASKYIGGPKGLNVNAQLRNVPLFKL